MVLIELTGLPGCGKTTIIDSVISNPEYSGRLITRDILFSEKVPNNWLRKYLISFCASFLLAGSYLSSKMANKKLYYKRLIQLIVYLDYKNKKTENPVFILDEGIVQYVSSLAFENKIVLKLGLKRLVRRIVKEYNPIIINYQILAETAYSRIMSRGKVNDRYYNNDPDYVKKLLNIKRQNIDLIINEFIDHFETVDLTDSSVDPSELLVKTLENTI